MQQVQDRNKKQRKTTRCKIEQPQVNEHNFLCTLQYHGFREHLFCATKRLPTDTSTSPQGYSWIQMECLARDEMSCQWPLLRNGVDGLPVSSDL